MSYPRVLIVEDHSILSKTLEEQVRGVHPKAQIYFTEYISDGLSRLESGVYDFVISDLGFEGGKRFDIVEAARKHGVPCIILTGYANRSFLQKALYIGIAGYVLKTSPLKELENAIREIGKPGTYLCPNAAAIRNNISNDLPYEQPKLNGIEEKILELTIAGKTQEEIAEEIGKSYHLVRHYRKEMLRKNNCTISVLIKRYLEWRG